MKTFKQESVFFKIPIMKFRFIQQKLRPSSIQKFEESISTNNIVESLRKDIRNIDQKIIVISKELLEVETVAIKSMFSRNNNWIDSVRMRWLKSTINESVTWHRDRLALLTQERKQLKIKLEKLTGEYWPNKVKQIIAFLILFSIASLSILIIFLGFMTALYLLPIWGSFLLFYLFVQYRKSQRL